jgi:hypothetical protein
MLRTQIGVNPDGSPHWLYTFEEGDEHVVATGRGLGLVQLADGTVVDVTEPYVVVASKRQANEVAHHVALQVEKTGALDTTHPASGERIPWRHTDCPHRGCKAPRTEVTDPQSPGAKRQAELLRQLVTGES